MARKKLLKKFETREDGKFQLFNLVELEKLIEAGNNKIEWYCLGRKTENEGSSITYCIHAYHDSTKPAEGCPGDCAFYKKIHAA